MSVKGEGTVAKNPSRLEADERIQVDRLWPRWLAQRALQLTDPVL